MSKWREKTEVMAESKKSLMVFISVVSYIGAGSSMSPEPLIEPFKTQTVLKTWQVAVSVFHFCRPLASAVFS